MNRYAEERAAAILQALEIRGFPRERDVPRLIEWLGNCLVVELDPGETRASMALLADGRGHITKPDSLDESEGALSGLHELAHYLQRHGAAALFWTQYLLTRDERQARQARTATAKEEAQVRDFTWAWLLPSWLMTGSPEQISEASGCSVAMVSERMEQLRGWVLPTGFPPQWCAYWDFSLYVRRSALVSVVEMTSRRGGRSFIVPIEGRDLEASIRPLKADLLALTSEELALKYEALEATGEVWPINSSDAMAVLA